MRLLPLVLLFGISICLAQDQKKFYISLKEQKTATDTGNEKFVLLTSSFTRKDDVFEYDVTISNQAPDYFKVLLNYKECPSGICQGSIGPLEMANFTIQKDGSHLDIFTFEYNGYPIVSVLGCDAGLYNDDTCTRISETVNGADAESSFWDEVCICTISQPYCEDQTKSGTCASGVPTWWQSDGISTSTPLITTTQPSTSSETSPLPIVKYLDVSITLNETSNEDGKSYDLAVRGSLNCSVDACNYMTIIDQETSYFAVFVDGADCSESTCSGSLRKGDTSVTVIVKRQGQHLKLLEFQFEDQPNVAVLGCDSGLSLENTCLLVGTYTDDVCSCRGEQTKCNEQSQKGVCIGGDVTWWIDDPSSGTSVPTTSVPISNPYLFDVSFVLSESPSSQDYHNITINAVMNCTVESLKCMFTVSYEYTQDYYTIRVGGKECDRGICFSSLSKGQTVRVTASRLGETLDVFDLQFIEFPNVVVLGCSSGLMSEGGCRRNPNSYFSSTVKMTDILCICQTDEPPYCDEHTITGECDVGQPVWWKSDAVSTTPIPGEFDFNISLTETVSGSTQSLIARVSLKCTDDVCAFTISFANGLSEYFTVFIADREFTETSYQSSFSKNQQIPVTVKRKGEKLDWFDLVYQNVVILSCSSGFLISEKCSKVTNKSPITGVQDEVCVCENDSDTCDSGLSEAACLIGSPAWWVTDPDATTTAPPTTTSPPLQMMRFTVLLNESEVDAGSGEHNISVQATFNCTQISCDYEADYVNEAPGYFSVRFSGLVCPSPCNGTILKGGPDVKMTVHRTRQHLDLIVFGFDTESKVLVAGCEKIGKKSLQFHRETGGNECVHVPHTLNDAGLYLNDHLCVCKELGTSCDDLTPVGKCTKGQLTWWVDDEGQTTASSPTTTEDIRNHFQFDISLNETKRRNGESRLLVVSSSMSCSAEECGYEMRVNNEATDYFSVFVGKQDCPLPSCQGSFMKGKSVNVTVYRGEQKIDLFDFEYTDVPKVVVLGCEDGLAEYGTCLGQSNSMTIDNEEYTDEVCSCRSHPLDCSTAYRGVCRSGMVKWWRDIDETTSPAPTTTSSEPTTSFSTTTVSTTPPDYVPSLQNLSDSTVGINNVSQILNDTLTYSREGVNLNGTQIFEISKVLHKSANVAGITADNAMQILTNMDACLNAHEDELRKGHSKEYNLLGVLQPMVHNTVDKTIRYLDGKNMGFGAKHVDCSTIDSDDGLIDYGPDIGFAPLNDTNRLSATQQNSIIVPLQDVCRENEKVTHVFFTIYRHQKLFVGDRRYRVYGGEQSDPGNNGDDDFGRESFRTKRDTEQNDTSLPYPPPAKCEEQISVPDQSSVLSASILNDGVAVSRMPSGAEKPIVAKLQFNIGKMLSPLHGSLIVSWFDQSALSWQTKEQCTVTEVKDGIVTATCEHLTDFSALILGQLNAQIVCSSPLIIIGYIVNAVSIACLIFLITIGLMFYVHAPSVTRILAYIRGQLQTQGDIINLAYYSVFLLFFVLLIGFMDQSKGEANSGTTSTYCIVIASLSYFSLIGAIMMSMLIGIRMVSHFFPPKLRAFFGAMTSPAAALSIGIVIPLTLTLTLALIDTSFFKRDDGFCWVRPDYVVYAVIVPITIPIINGVLCSTFAVYKMFFQAKRGLSNKEISHHDAEFWSKVFGLVIMQVAMGLPWGIEFIIIGISGASPWNYAFVILLGTQGIDLFLIFLYRRQRLVSESKKWSAREQRLAGNSKTNERVETLTD